jgi:Flp pilus assembly protein TadG
LGPHHKPHARRLRRNDEEGAELIEFAIVVVILIMLIYGIVTFGLILSAKETLTQAASDGARAGIVATSTAIATAQTQASNDLSWMGKGTCGTSGTTITCVATEAPCASNSNNTCLTMTVTYNYSASPLFPPMPGLSLVTPSTISSSSTLELSTPSS